MNVLFKKMDNHCQFSCLISPIDYLFRSYFAGVHCCSSGFKGEDAPLPQGFDL